MGINSNHAHTRAYTSGRHLAQRVPSSLLIPRDSIHGDARNRGELSPDVDEFADGCNARYLAIEVTHGAERPGIPSCKVSGRDAPSFQETGQIKEKSAR